jgi:hypothetical protein
MHLGGWRKAGRLGRPGFLLLAALAAVPGAAAAPLVTNLFPRSGATVRALGQLEVFFNGPVQGAHAPDLLVNDVPATNLIVRPGGALTFQFAQPAPGPVYCHQRLVVHPQHQPRLSGSRGDRVVRRQPDGVDG